MSCSTGCGRPVHGHGLCDNHYRRWKRSGDPGPVGLIILPTVEERFWQKVEKQRDGCWLWTGTTRQGYGHFRVDGRSEYAHRFSYQHFVGPIPDGMEIDHLCSVRPCVNPDHLEPVTSSENTRRWWETRPRV